MLRKLFEIAADKMALQNAYTKDQKEQIEYVMRILFFELAKTFGILLIFSIFGYIEQAIIITIVMFFTKPFIGGYHEDTQLKCFIATIIIISSITILACRIKLDLVTVVILNGISLFTIWNTAPIINPKMPISRKELINKNRTIGISFTIIFIFLSISFINFTIISSCITWTILIQAMLMFNKKTNNK